MNRATKPKTCKSCGDQFIPGKGSQPFVVWCSVECGISIARKRQEQARERKRKRESRELRARKELIKPRSKWLQEAQSAFNAYIRARDRNQPCISCGRTEGQDHLTGGYWHAGHYRSTAAQPALRYNEINCHKQCPTCNNHKSGNITEYRIGLVNRIGASLVEWLEIDHPIIRGWEADELAAIKKHYREQIKLLEIAYNGGRDGSN